MLLLECLCQTVLRTVWLQGGCPSSPAQGGGLLESIPAQRAEPWEPPSALGSTLSIPLHPHCLSATYAHTSLASLSSPIRFLTPAPLNSADPSSVSWSEQWPGLRWHQAGPPAATSVIGREAGSRGAQVAGSRHLLGEEGTAGHSDELA